MALNKSTLSEQIYNILREDILKQDQIHCGDKLTLKMLQNRFQVSSTPIREALTRLSQDGLITYYSNIGVNVVELTEEDLDHLYTFIADLDSLAISYASKSKDLPHLVEALKELMDNSYQALEKNDLKAWEQYSDRFHLIFYDYCGNHFLVESASRIRSQLTIFSSQYEADQQIPMEIQKEHDIIYQEFLEGKIDSAVASMKQHLMHSLTFAKKYL